MHEDLGHCIAFPMNAYCRSFCLCVSVDVFDRRNAVLRGRCEQLNKFTVPVLLCYDTACLCHRAIDNVQ